MKKKNEIDIPTSCFNRAKPHELLFVLLERDESAPVAIFAWVNDRLRRGKNKFNDPEILEALDCARNMAAFAYNCPGCGWRGPMIRAIPDPAEPPRCPICG